MQLVLYLILMKLFFEKYTMKSIIGRKGIAKVLRSFDDLRYGDVVEISDEGVTMAHIYMPMNHIYYNYDYIDGFVRYNSKNTRLLSYWHASDFKYSYPLHKEFDDVRIIRYITHINEWQSISSGDDIKKLFNKYNIPIEK